MSAPVNTFQVVANNVRLHGIETGSREMFEEMNGFGEASSLRPVINRTFGFDEACAALARLESGKHFGKVVVEF
jgi:NADPH:quinone reductase-like Zn-dependent oxidoreductase